MEISSTYVELFYAPGGVKVGQEDVSGGSLEKARIIDEVPTETESLQGRKCTYIENRWKI